LHPNLRTAGTLPSLDMPHHIRADEWCRYREGVTLAPTATEPDSETPRKKSKLEKPKRKSNADIDGADKKTIVDAGFPVEIPVDIPSMTRVTLKFPDETAPSDFPFLRINHSVSDGAERPPLNADAIDPAGPREQDGYYWGYSLRRAATLSAIFTESPFEDGYDVSIGTSERGRATWDVMPGSSGDNKLPDTFSHALLIFGGVAGLEVAAAADKELAAKGIGKDNLAELFDFYVNVCPGQGSRTIRTEEAVWIALGQLRSWVTVAANKQ
jgi:methyltransferase